MAVISEYYLSTLSNMMKDKGLERYFVALLAVFESDGQLSQKDLAVRLKRDKVMTMRIVDYLSERELVKRIPDPKDRRSHILHTTDKGKKVVKEVVNSIEATNNIFFQEFNDQEKNVFKKGMLKLMHRIDTLPESDFIVKAFKKHKK